MRAWVFVVLGGCYAPQAAPGAPCGTGDQCPSGLECVQGVCELPGTLPTDATGDSTPPSDTAIDAGVSPDAPADAPPAALIAHWTFDDDPTDGAADSTDNGHTADCADHCPTLVTGRIGMAYHFDSSVPQYLVVPDAVDFRGPVTIALWFRTPDVSKAISMFAKPVGTGSDNSWQLEIDSSKASFSGGSVHYLYSPDTVSTGVWHHAAGTWDGTTKRLYLDGVEVAHVDSMQSYDTHDIFLGADQNGGSLALPWAGDLDDLRVYDGALTTTEIAALAQP